MHCIKAIWVLWSLAVTSVERVTGMLVSLGKFVGVGMVRPTG